MERLFRFLYQMTGIEDNEDILRLLLDDVADALESHRQWLEVRLTDDPTQRLQPLPGGHQVVGSGGEHSFHHVASMLLRPERAKPAAEVFQHLLPDRRL